MQKPLLIRPVCTNYMTDCKTCGHSTQECDWCEVAVCANCDSPCVEPSCDRIFCADDIPHNCEACDAVMCPKHQCVCACLKQLCCDCTELVSDGFSCPDCRR